MKAIYPAQANVVENPTEHDVEELPAGYRRWLLRNSFLAAVSAGLTIAPHGMIVLAVWWAWLQSGLRTYTRTHKKTDNPSSSFTESLEAARSGSLLVLVGVSLRFFGVRAPSIEQWLNGWTLVVVPLIIAWFSFIWAYARTHPSRERVLGSQAEKNRVVWACRLLAVLPLLELSVLGAIDLGVASGRLQEDALFVLIAGAIALVGLAVVGFTAAGLLLYRPTFAKARRRILAVVSLLLTTPALLVLLGMVVPLQGADSLTLLPALLLLLGVATPMGVLLIGWFATDTWGRVAATPITQTTPPTL